MTKRSKPFPLAYTPNLPVKFLIPMVKAGNPNAICDLGIRLARGDFVKGLESEAAHQKRMNLALRHLKDAESRGDSNASLLLGQAYYQGVINYSDNLDRAAIFPKDMDKALHHFGTALNAGEIEAQAYLTTIAQKAREAGDMELVEKVHFAWEPPPKPEIPTGRGSRPGADPRP